MTDPTERALRLLGYLESRAYWGGAELAGKLGVTTRTLRRDVDRLRSLGYPVEADAGPGGGYSLGRGAALPPLLLDDDEAVAVTLGLTAATVTGLVPDPEAALRALSKLDGVLPSPVRARVIDLRQRVDVVGRASALGPEVLGAAAEATRRRLRLRFSYTDRRGATSARTVEPYQLVHRYGHWYLVCFDVDRQDWRTFRLERASEPEVTAWEFRPRADAPAALESARQGMPHDAYLHQFRLRFQASLESVRAVLPPGVGRFVRVADGVTDVYTGADSTSEAAGWLMHIPLRFEVEGPEQLRRDLAAVADRARQLVDTFTEAADSGVEPPPA